MSTETAHGRSRATPRRWRRPGVLLLSGLLLALAAGRVLLGVGASAVLSDSMAPAYQRGDLVVTRRVDASSLQVGDVPVLLAPGRDRPVVHRIVERRGTAGSPVVRTKGDANPAVDAHTSRVTGDTVPVVVALVPGLGRLAAGPDDPRRRALLVAVAGLLLTALAVRGVLRTLPVDAPPLLSHPTSPEGTP